MELGPRSRGGAVPSHCWYLGNLEARPLGPRVLTHETGTPWSHGYLRQTAVRFWEHREKPEAATDYCCPLIG